MRDIPLFSAIKRNYGLYFLIEVEDVDADVWILGFEFRDLPNLNRSADTISVQIGKEWSIVVFTLRFAVIGYRVDVC